MISVYPDPDKARDSITKDINDLESHHSFLITTDYTDAIGLGAVEGHSKFRGFGRRTALSTATTGDDLWEGAATTLVYPNQSTGEQVTVVSTNANDTLAGSGVQKVDIHYLDASGNPQHEIVNMNGTTPVNTVATDIRFIQFCHTSQGNFGVLAAGDITFHRVGAPATVFQVIKQGGNMTLNTARMVPAGFTFYLKELMASAASNKPINVRFRATCDQDGDITPGIFIFNEIFELQDSNVPLNVAVPRSFPPLCIIKGTAYSTTSGGQASLSYGGYIET